MKALIYNGPGNKQWIDTKKSPESLNPQMLLFESPILQFVELIYTF